MGASREAHHTSNCVGHVRGLDYCKYAACGISVRELVEGFIEIRSRK